MPSRALLAPLALLIAASIWGMVWYPYRLLEQVGLSGSLSSLLTYLLALLVLLLWYRRRVAWHASGNRLLLLAIAFTAGWTNLAYVLSVLQGEIMRVLLLFYLAPLWTVLFARLVLAEHANVFGYLVVALSFIGAAVMLYDPARGLPFPANGAEWLGLSAGVGFALTNVLSRRLKNVPAEIRAVWIFAGVVIITLPPLALEMNGVLANLAGLSASDWWLVVLTAGLLILATLTAQYGLAHTAANRAIVILLMELVVAAIFSWLWAGELMGLREWLGGALIIAASLFSGAMEREPDTDHA